MARVVTLAVVVLEEESVGLKDCACCDLSKTCLETSWRVNDRYYVAAGVQTVRIGRIKWRNPASDVS